MVAEAEGDIEKVDKTIKITEIRVHYKLPIQRDQMETADRVLQLHPAGCPAHQTVKDAVRIKIDAQYDLR